MKIGIISGSANCIPLLQFLTSNKIDVCLFPGEIEQQNTDFELVRYFCNLSSIEIESSTDLYKWFMSKDIEICFVVGYKKKINLSFINQSLQQNLFNIHFGDLPSFSGPNPVFWQLKLGVENCSMCIHRINEKFDDGEIVWRKEIKNEAHFNYGLLNQIFSQAVIEGIYYLLNLLFDKKSIPVLPRDKENSTYYSKPNLTDVLIQWDKMRADEIIHLINACNPWNKGASTIYNGVELKIMDAEKIIQKSSKYILPGTIISTNDQIQVACLDFEILSLTFLNLNGIFFPARFARKYGIIEQQVLTNNVQKQTI